MNAKLVHYSLGPSECMDEPQQAPDTNEIIEVTCEKCLTDIAESANDWSRRRMRRLGTLRVKLAEARAEVADIERRMANVSSWLLGDLREASDAAKARKKIGGAS